MTKPCPNCQGKRREVRAKTRSWWEALTFQPTTFESLCDFCSGSGVIALTAEEEERERDKWEREQQEREARLEEQTWQRFLRQAIQQSSQRQPYGAALPHEVFVKTLIEAGNPHMIARLPSFLEDERSVHGSDAVHYNYLRRGVARILGDEKYSNHLREIVEPLLALLQNESVDLEVRGGVAISLAALGNRPDVAPILKSFLSTLRSKLRTAADNSQWGVAWSVTSALVDVVDALVALRSSDDPNVPAAYLELLQPPYLRDVLSHGSMLKTLLRGLLCLELHDERIARQFVAVLVMLRLELYSTSNEDAQILKFLAKVDSNWPDLPEAQALIPKLIEEMVKGLGGRGSRAREILVEVGNADALVAMLSRLQPDRRKQHDAQEIRAFTTAARIVLEKRLPTVPKAVLQIAANLRDLKAKYRSEWEREYGLAASDEPEWEDCEAVEFPELRTMAREELARRGA